MPRRMRFIVFIGIVAMLILATGLSAGAAPEDDIQATEAEIADAQERLRELRTEESAALADYNTSLQKMNELNAEIDAAEKDLTAAQERLARAQDELEERAKQVYKSGNVAFMDVLLGTDNFQEFATRLDLWMRLLGQEQAEVEAFREAKDDLEQHKSELETQRVHRVEAVDEALAHKQDVAEAETEAETFLNSLNGELQTAIEAEQERQARLTREAAEQAAAEQAAAEQAAAEQAAAEQAAAEQAPEPEPAAQPAPRPDPEDAAAAAEAQRQAELAAERAAKAEERAAQRAAEEEAEEQAAIEAAAAEQARDEARAAARAAEQEAEQAAEERAALEEQRQEEQAALEQKRLEEREALAEDRASARAAAASARAAEEEEESTATATATASADGRNGRNRGDDSTATASADGRNDRNRGDDSTATATAAGRAGGGGSSSCGDDFGGVASDVAEYGCEIEAKFGLEIQGMGYSYYHDDGRSLDIYTSDVRLGNQVRNYLWARYPVSYTIWQDVYYDGVHKWSGYGHFDHVHVTF